MGLRESFRSTLAKWTGTDSLLREVFRSQQNEQLLIESMSELQIAMEDRGWQQIGMSHDTDFDLRHIQLITKIARVFRLKNPLIKRAVKIQADYVWGKGVQIKSPDERTQKALDQFLADNESEMGLQGLWDKECTLRTDGNLFLVMFTDTSTGEVRVRTIDSLEIADKFCNPDDASEPWYFKRVWVQRKLDARTGSEGTVTVTKWYPALSYDAQEKTLGGDPVESGARILHVKVGGLEKWKWGLSELYAALDWAKAFTAFLSNWATIQEALARIAGKIITPGGPKAKAKVKTKIGHTTLADGSGQADTNPPPVVGAMAILGPNQDIEPLRTRGATTAPDEARQIKLQVSAATDTPEHMFGDPSTSNLATSKTLDRPTELSFANRQRLHAQWIRTVCQYAVSQAISRPSGALYEAAKNKKPVDPTVVVTFPPILEHELKEVMDALVSIATMNGNGFASGLDPKTFLTIALELLPGVENVPDLVETVYPAASYDPQEWAADPSPEEPEPQPTPGDKRQEALIQFRKTIESLIKAA